jgi:hypothetical protein
MRSPSLARSGWAREQKTVAHGRGLGVQRDPRHIEKELGFIVEIEGVGNLLDILDSLVTEPALHAGLRRTIYRQTRWHKSRPLLGCE